MVQKTKAAGSKSMSRRAFVTGATALGAAALPSSAFAQMALRELIAAPSRGDWNDQFDVRSTGAQTVATNQPVFSGETVADTQNAIAWYQQIVSSGGWPMVPAERTLQLGVQDPAVSLLRQRLMVSGDLPRSAGFSQAFDTYVETAVKRFQALHGLPADGIAAQHTFDAMNVPAALRLGQLRTNLVRLQSMSGYLGDRFVMVNIPAASIEAVEHGQVVQRHKAVVGQVDRQTPILNSKITSLNLNPYWHAPASIVRKDIIPLMRKNPQYLAESNIHIYDSNGNEIPPETIDWTTDEAVKYLFRQDPGPKSAMASVKINFPNPHAVYMHDTPQQSLFSELMRFESSGCVRVQNVRDLVVWLAEGNPEWNRQRIEQVIATHEPYNIILNNPVPVYFAYITGWATDPTVVQFRDDIYHRDGVEQLAMNELTTTAYAPGEQSIYGEQAAYGSVPF